MRLQRPGHATVVAYLALVVALGGSAYAIEKVGSRDVTNDSLRSKDLRDEHGVRNRDVSDETLTGRAIRETTLDARGFSAFAHNGTGGCDPNGLTPTVCADARIELPRAARIMMIGTGGLFSQGQAAQSTCEVQVDGRSAGEISPGEVSSDNTDVAATEAFATTGLSDVLSAGPHTVALKCNQRAGDVQISQPFIAAIALGAEP